MERAERERREIERQQAQQAAAVDVDDTMELEEDEVCYQAPRPTLFLARF